MTTHRIHKLTLATMALLGMPVMLSVAGEWTIAETTSDVSAYTVHYRGNPLLVYQFSPTQFKPYVRELYTVTGENLLRDSPSDHLHHHALMYAIKVNGINFWEEAPGAGVQRVVRTVPPRVTETSRSAAGVVLKQQIAWVASEDAFLPVTNLPALLLEQRTLTLWVDEAQQETCLEWHSQFKVGTKTNKVSLTGANYHGLGMRFPARLDPVASHLTAAGEIDLSDNRQDVSAYPWAAVRFESATPATLAVFGAEENARGAPVFFSMRTPFAYLSATQGLDKEPLEYTSGDEFSLRYMVAAWPVLKTGSELDQRAGKFVSQAAQ